MSRFKVGDRVKIVRKVEKVRKWSAGEKMESTLGKEGDIVGAYDLHSIVSVGGVPWAYDNDCIELVVDRPKEPCSLESELLNSIDSHKREIEKLEDMLTCIRLMDKHQVKLTFEEKFKF